MPLVPLWLQSDGPTGAGHPGSTLRRLLQVLAADRPGIIDAAGFTVTSGGGLVLNWTAGRAFVAAPAATPLPGYYFADLEAGTVNAPAAHATLSRIDLVVLQINDSEYSGLLANDGTFVQIVQGTPSGSPVAPAVPDRAIPLLQYTLAPAAGTPSALVDRRIFWQRVDGVPTFVDANDRTTRFPTPAVGATSYLTSDKHQYTYNGTSWVPAPAVTVSPSLPSGTGQPGDLWITTGTVGGLGSGPGTALVAGAPNAAVLGAATGPTDLVSLVVPAGVASTGQFLRLQVPITVVNTSGGAVSVDLTVKLNGVAVLSLPGAGLSFPNAANPSQGILDVLIALRSLTAQHVAAGIQFATPAAGEMAAPDTTRGGYGNATATADFAGAVTVAVAASKSSAAGTSSVTVQAATLELVG